MAGDMLAHLKRFKADLLGTRSKAARSEWRLEVTAYFRRPSRTVGTSTCRPYSARDIPRLAASKFGLVQL